MKNWLSRFIPSSIKNFLKKLLKVNHREDLQGIDEQILKSNEELLRSLGFDVNKVKSIIEKNGLVYAHPRLSWHYHIFAGIKSSLSNKGNKAPKILEIGTHNALFAKFLSTVFYDSEIFTIDLPEDHNQFQSTYRRDNESQRVSYLKERNEILNLPNINFIEMDSTNILQYFEGETFDLIWVDGDHHNPQVTIDIMNSLQLLRADGIMCVDDIIMSENFDNKAYVSNESFLTLNKLENNNIITTHFITKRIQANQSTVKLVSISKKKNT